jgi:hypothetical protein
VYRRPESGSRMRQAAIPVIASGPVAFCAAGTGAKASAALNLRMEPPRQVS